MFIDKYKWNQFCVYYDYYSKWPCLALSRIQDSQDLQEEIDDVQVEVNDTYNVLLRAQVLHDHVCVEDNETGEDKSADHCQNRVSGLIVKEDL